MGCVGDLHGPTVGPCKYGCKLDQFGCISPFVCKERPGNVPEIEPMPIPKH